MYKIATGRSTRKFRLACRLPASRDKQANRCTTYPRRRGRRPLKAKLWMVFALGAGALIFSAPLAAHHGNAAYDTDKRVTVKGIVTDWHWSNPHCILQLDVKDESGNVVHWVAETENPSTMTRMGWSEKAFKPGDQITVTALPLKNGRPIGRIIEVLSPTGQRLPGIRIPETGADSPQPYPKQ